MEQGPPFPPVRTPERVLAVAYNQHGAFIALHVELQMEVNRLCACNLRRDDQCLSDHGLEGRFPYLDEDVIAYLDALLLELSAHDSAHRGSILRQRR